MALSQRETHTEEVAGPVGGWLDDQESSAWRAVAMLLLQLPGALETQLQHDSGISLFDYLVMSTLSMSPDREMRMCELAQLTNASPSRLSNVAKRLEQGGWILRKSHAGDARSVVAVLTDSGMDLVHQAAPGHVDAVRNFLIEPLTKSQLDALAAVGERVERRLLQANSNRPSC